MPNIPLNFKSHFLRRSWYQIKRHPVHFYCDLVFLLLEINVAHVDPESSRLRELLAFDDIVIFRQSILKKTISMQCASVIQRHEEGKIEVYGINQVLLLPLAADILFYNLIFLQNLLFIVGVLRFFQSIRKVAL
jgi:hypothetical protein